MHADTGSSAGPSEKDALSREFFNKLVNWTKSRRIDEDDAEDLAQKALIAGWETYKRKGGDRRALPSLIRHILNKQLIPQYFRDQHHVVKGSLVKKQKRIGELSMEEQQSVSPIPSDGAIDRETLYHMMKNTLGAEKLESFFDDLLEARAEADKKHFIKKAASIAKITEGDARNRYRQIKERIKADPELLDHLLDR